MISKEMELPMTVALYFDCFAGISGDMSVAALIDLGVPLEHLRFELAKLALPSDSYELSVCRTNRHHLDSLKFDVTVHDLHVHRKYSSISTMIADSKLHDSVRSMSQKIFHRLADAEARVHGIDIDEVQFHEVGAVDSIVDIAGTAICLEYLGVERIYAAPLPLGSGFIEAAHGRLPVPAPATAELLRGLVVHNQCGPGERVTPTGAAIVAALSVYSENMPAMTLTRVGCGAGSKDYGDCPNILRAFLGHELSDSNTKENDRIVVVETNIDDSTAEVLGYVMEQLFENGALDVFFSPIQMKKNRPATKLSFLCHPSALDALARLVMTETSAIGLRYYSAERMKLERRIETLDTIFGNVQFKLLFDDGSLLRATPEYDDCRRIAIERRLPYTEVVRHLSAIESTKFQQYVDSRLD